MRAGEFKLSKEGSLVISFLLGALTAASFEDPMYFPLYVISLIAFGIILDTGYYEANFLKGYFFGFGFFLTAAWWLGFLKGLFFLPFLLAAFEALFFGLPAWLTNNDFLQKKSTRFYRFYLLIFIFEWLRGQGVFGFPWMSSGFYLQGTLFKDLLLLFGVYGCSFLIYFFVAAFLSFWSYRRAKDSVALLFLTAVLLLLPVTNFLQPEKISSKPLKVTLLQDNLLPEEKHEPDPDLRTKLILNNFLRLISLIPDKTDLIVFPETSFPYTFPFNHSWKDYFRTLSKQKNAVLLVGVQTFSGGRYYNSIVAFSSLGAFDRYDKRYLVPFGEYVPFRDWFRFFSIVSNSIDFSSGKKDPLIKIGDFKCGAGICWESAIPGYGRELALKGANLLVFVTNDNWFLFSNQSRSHWRHTKAQADASGLAVVQSANAGITGWYFNGKESVLVPWVVGALKAEVPLVEPVKGIIKLQKLFELTTIAFSLFFVVFYTEILQALKKFKNF